MNILGLLATSLTSDSCEITSQGSKEESGQTRINVFCLIKLKQQQTVRRVITANKTPNKQTNRQKSHVDEQGWGLQPGGRALAQYAQASDFKPHHHHYHLYQKKRRSMKASCTRQGMVGGGGVLKSQHLGSRDQKDKAIFSYIISLRSAWVM